MNKKFENKESQLEFYEKWGIEILDFMKEISHPVHHDYYDNFKEILKYSVQLEDLRGTKLAIKDLNSWAKSLHKTKVVVLNAKLTELFGQDLYTDQNERKIKKIILAGEIKTQRQYELIKREFEKIHEDATKSERKEELRKLVDQYPNSK